PFASPSPGATTTVNTATLEPSPPGRRSRGPSPPGKASRRSGFCLSRSRTPSKRSRLKEPSMSRFQRLAGCILFTFVCTAADWTAQPEHRWGLRSAKAPGPAPHLGGEGGADFDPIHRLWIHHAGHDGVPQGFHLFTFDPATNHWEQRFPNTSPPGACCVDGA